MVTLGGIDLLSLVSEVHLCVCFHYCMSVLDCCSSRVVHPSVIELLAFQLQNANASLNSKLVCTTQERVPVSAKWCLTAAANIQHMYNINLYKCRFYI